MVAVVVRAYYREGKERMGRVRVKMNPCRYAADRWGHTDEIWMMEGWTEGEAGEGGRQGYL